MGDTPKTEPTKRSQSLQARPTIGLLVHLISDAHGSVLWRGCMDAANDHDANLICFQGNHLKSTSGYLAQGNVIYQLASAENVDGLVVSSATLALGVGAGEVQHFVDTYRPLPRVSLGLSLKGIPSITVENYLGMREVISHLIEVHGFRRIAFLSGPEGHPESKIRYQAYTDALDEHGISVDPALVSPPTEWDEATGRAAVGVFIDERGLQPGSGIEAIAASNDETALGALTELQMRGFHVPGDIAVTGFDGFEKSEYCTPPLTTVRQPVYEQSYMAVEMLIAQLRGEDVPNQENMPTELVVRQSCGCPDPMVVQAAVDRADGSAGKATGVESLRSALDAHREHILAELRRSAEALSESMEPGWAESLLDTFSDDVSGKTSNTFLVALDLAIRHTMMMNRDVRAWHNILSAHRRQFLPYLSNQEQSVRAENLWQQGRVIIAGATYRVQAFRETQAADRADLLQSIGQTLITTFDLANSFEALTTGLPQLGFPSAYVLLYDFPEKPETWANLIFAYDENGRVELQSGGVRFPTRQLIPPALQPSHRRFAAVIKPLYFQNQQLGYVVFEIGPQDGKIYETLRGQISSMIQGTLLMQQVQQHTAQLDTIVTETLATSEEMLTTISQTSRKAQAVADAAQQSVEVSKTGQDAIANTVTGMETIQGQVEDIAQSILALSGFTQQIGEIVSAVEEIANQSRMLALNASIEAARAGDEGRGFAVVAREMRSLAGQSREATTKVSDILNEIQRAANKTVMVTEEGGKGAQHGMELARRAGEAIRDLAMTIEESAGVAIQIAASTHQQTNAMDQLVTAMKSIKEASMQTTASIKDVGL